MSERFGGLPLPSHQSKWETYLTHLTKLVIHIELATFLEHICFFPLEQCDQQISNLIIFKQFTFPVLDKDSCIWNTKRIKRT